MLEIHKQKINDRCAEILKLDREIFMQFVVWLLLVLAGWIFIFIHKPKAMLFVLIGQLVFFYGFNKDSKKSTLLKRELKEIYHFDWNEFMRSYVSRIKRKG